VPITYQLLIEVVKPLRIAVGALGVRDFPAGRYVYTGSAKRNFEARIARHLSRTKTLLEVRRFDEAECPVNQNTAGEIIARRFGASDCGTGCGSHLKRV
jgi:Uri superfamily endonuclease